MGVLLFTGYVFDGDSLKYSQTDGFDGRFQADYRLAQSGKMCPINLATRTTTATVATNYQIRKSKLSKCLTKVPKR